LPYFLWLSFSPSIRSNVCGKKRDLRQLDAVVSLPLLRETS
jgi:hypothetical protein